MKIIVQSIFLSLIVLSGRGAELQSPHILFYCGFEDSTEGVSVGESQARETAAVTQFGTGRRGRSLIAQEGSSHLSYQIADNLKPDQGSIEMWIRPENWNGNDAKSHLFFEAPEGGWLVIYKFQSPGAGRFLIAPDRTGKNQVAIEFDVSSWATGDWHQVVATWNSDEMAFYVDGVQVGKLENPPLPENFLGTFQIGDRSWTEEGVSAMTYIDEFCIYDRALSPAEVERSFVFADSRAQGGPIP